MSEDKKTFKFITNDMTPRVATPVKGIDALSAASQEATFSEVFSASFEREQNLTLRGAASLLDKATQVINFEYNPYDDIKGTEFEAFAPEFMYAPNQEYVSDLKDRIVKQQTNQQLQAEGGLASFVGSMSGGFVDITTIVPGVNLIKAGSVLGKAVKVGLSAGAAAFISESFGEQFDVTKDFEETFNTTIAASIFGGILGAGVGSIYKLKLQKAESNKMQTIFNTPEKDMTVDDLLAETIKSEKVGDPNFKLAKFGDDSFDLQITNPAFNLWTKFSDLIKANPLTRAFNRTATTPKQLALELHGTNLRVKGELQGKVRPISIDNEIHARTAKVNNILSDKHNFYSEYKKGNGKLSRGQFDDELANALIKGDKSVIREVELSAKKIREYLDGFIDPLIKAKVLPEDFKGVKNATSYFTRVWDYSKVTSKHTRFKDVIEGAIIKHDPEADVVLVRKQIVSNILDDATPMHRKLKYKSKQGRERILDLADQDIQEFLVTDIDFILTKYSRDVNTELAFRERFGSTDMADEIKALQNEYEELIDAATSDKVKKKLIDEKADAVKDLEASRDIVQGRFGLSNNPNGLYERFIEPAVMTANFLAYMGKGAISQIADLHKFVFISRLSKSEYFQDVFKGTKEFVKKVELSKKDLRELEIGIDTYQASRAAAIGDIDDFAESSNWFKRAANKVTGAFSVINLMSPMNDFTRRFSGNHIMNNIVDDIQANKVGKLSVSKQKDLLKLGIDDRLANVILKNVAKHSEVKEGIAYLNINKWGEDGVELSAIVTNEVNNTIIKPGTGDKSLWMRRPIFKSMAQFRGFTAGAYMKTLAPMLQDIAGVGGAQSLKATTSMLSSIMLGGMVFMLRDKISGKDTDDVSMEKFILEGFDRGGTFPVVMDLNNILDQFGLGAASGMGIQKVSRFRNKKALDVILGAPAGTINDMFDVGANLANGTANQADMNALYRRIPGFNLLYWNWLTNQLVTKKNKNRIK